MKTTVLMLLILSIAASVYSFFHDWCYLGALFLVFFSPALLLCFHVWERLCPLKKLSLIATALGMSMFAVVMELIGVQHRFWVFFEDVDALCPYRIGNIPIEEILFYYGATVQVCLLYAALEVQFIGLGLKEGTPGYHGISRKTLNIIGKTIMIVVCLAPVVYTVYKLTCVPLMNADESALRGAYGRWSYSEGRWVPAWALMISPYFLLGIYFLKKNIKTVHLVAFAFTIMINLPLYFLFEHNAIVRGHWVYNKQRILGPTIGVTPIEEVFMYLSAIFLSVGLYEGLYEVLKRFSSHEHKKVINDAVTADVTMKNGGNC